MRYLRLLPLTVLLCAAAAAVPSPAAAARARIVTRRAQEIAWTRGFDVMVWDSINGVRRVSNGRASYDPALSSDGRYLVYDTKAGAGCRQIVMVDLWRKRTVPLPGLLRSDRGDCPGEPALSRNGRLLVWSGQGTTPGNPYDLYMYDVVARRPVPLPRIINSDANEQSPSLSDDGTRLAFVSGRNGTSHGDDVFVADISRLGTSGAVSLVVTPPGLQSSREQASAQMSGNGSTFVWTDGSTLAEDTSVFDARGAGRLVPAPALTAGKNTYAPAVNRDGSIVVVGHQARDLADTGVWVWRRSTGSFTRPRALQSTLGDDNPTVAWPALVADVMPPRLKLRCRGARRRVTCVLRSNEAGRGRVQSTLAHRKLTSRTVFFARAGTRKMVFRTRRSGTVRITAKLTDAAGNLGSTRSSGRAH